MVAHPRDMYGLYAALVVLVLAGGVVIAFTAKTQSSFSLKARIALWRQAKNQTKVLTGIRQEAQFIADPVRHEADMGIAELYELSEPGEGYLDPQIFLDNLTGGRSRN